MDFNESGESYDDPNDLSIHSEDLSEPSDTETRVLPARSNRAARVATPPRSPVELRGPPGVTAVFSTAPEPLRPSASRSKKTPGSELRPGRRNRAYLVTEARFRKKPRKVVRESPAAAPNHPSSIATTSASASQSALHTPSNAPEPTSPNDPRMQPRVQVQHMSPGTLATATRRRPAPADDVNRSPVVPKSRRKLSKTQPRELPRTSASLVQAIGKIIHGDESSDEGAPVGEYNETKDLWYLPAFNKRKTRERSRAGHKLRRQTANRTEDNMFGYRYPPTGPPASHQFTFNAGLQYSSLKCPGSHSIIPQLTPTSLPPFSLDQQGIEGKRSFANPAAVPKVKRVQLIASGEWMALHPNLTLLRAQLAKTNDPGLSHGVHPFCMFRGVLESNAITLCDHSGENWLASSVSSKDPCTVHATEDLALVMVADVLDPQVRLQMEWITSATTGTRWDLVIATEYFESELHFMIFIRLGRMHPDHLLFVTALPYSYCRDPSSPLVPSPALLVRTCLTHLTSEFHLELNNCTVVHLRLLSHWWSTYLPPAEDPSLLQCHFNLDLHPFFRDATCTILTVALSYGEMLRESFSTSTALQFECSRILKFEFNRVHFDLRVSPIIPIVLATSLFCQNPSTAYAHCIYRA